MKNSVVKHHSISVNEGLRNDGNYSLQYTTCPEKSFIVTPADGTIKYEEYNEKSPEAFVDKVISAKIEKIEIAEELAPKSDNKKRRHYSSRSPIKISREHCTRRSMVISSN
jgi:hypothetical protein